ncbi:MAG TPA: VOC family protein [Acidimicrobiales bacterium]|nr:VOC family protein [Acidimicrobiales bacterium]
MAVELNHHIVHARDAEASAAFFAELLGLDAPTYFGHFVVVQADNGVSLDFMTTDDPTYLVPNHYAFLVGEEEFDAIFGRIEERGLEYWADPGRNQPGRINDHDGGRGVYWIDPDGHLLEIITRPSGSGA